MRRRLEEIRLTNTGLQPGWTCPPSSGCLTRGPVPRQAYGAGPQDGAIQHGTADTQGRQCCDDDCWHDEDLSGQAQCWFGFELVWHNKGCCRWHESYAEVRFLYLKPRIAHCLERHRKTDMTAGSSPLSSAGTAQISRRRLTESPKTRIGQVKAL